MGLLDPIIDPVPTADQQDAEDHADDECEDHFTCLPSTPRALRSAVRFSSHKAAVSMCVMAMEFSRQGNLPWSEFSRSTSTRKTSSFVVPSLTVRNSVLPRAAGTFSMN